MGRFTVLPVVLGFIISPPLAIGENREAYVLEEYEQIMQLRDEAQLDTAIQKQKQLLKSTPSSEQRERSIHLYNLGILYVENQQPGKAISPFKKSVELRKVLYGPHHELLVEPLSHLGLAQYQDERWDAAIESLYEAQHILHRQHGVKTMKQDKVLDWMSMVLLKTGETKKVDLFQKLRYETFRFNLGINHPATIEAEIRLADWFQSSAQYKAADSSYQHAKEQIVLQGLEDQLLIQSLQGLAYNDYLRGRCCSDEILDQLEQAIIRDEHSDNVKKGRHLLSLADISLLREHGEPRFNTYKAAWDQGASLDPGLTQPVILGVSRIDRLVRAYKPTDHKNNISTTMIQFPSESAPPPTRIVGTPLSLCESELQSLVNYRDYSNYVVSVNFKVTSTGNAENIRVVDTNAPSALNQLIRRLVKLYRFRPRLFDGEPVDEEMTLRQTFGAPEAKPEFAAAQLAAIHGCHQLAMGH